MPSLNLFPASLREQPRWILYHLEVRRSSETKVPYEARDGGKHAKTNDSSTWVTFAEALDYYTQHSDRFSGLGYVFVKEDGIVGIDLDHCVNSDTREIDEWAKDIVDMFSPSYAEFSQSLTGIHIYVEGHLPAALRRRIPNAPQEKAAIEMYSTERYFVVTGDRLDGTVSQVLARQDDVTELYYRYSAEEEEETKPQQKKNKAYDDARPPLSEEDIETILTQARGAKNSAKFDMLWNGGYDGYLSDSEADLAFCTQLAFWCNRNPEIVDVVFRASPRYEKRCEKWDRDDYRAETLRKACSKTSAVYGGWKQSAPVEDEIDLVHDFEATDVGNAEAVQALYGHVLHYNPSHGWLVYTGTHWEPGTEYLVDRMVVDTLRRRRRQAFTLELDAIVKRAVPNNSIIAACKARLAVLPDIYASVDEFDADPDLLNTQSGIVDLRTGEVFPHAPEYKITTCLSASIGTAEQELPWVEILGESVCHNHALLDYIQMAVGYTLTGHTSEEVVFYLYGPTRSGKGTFIEALLTLLGKQLALSRDFNTFTAPREKGDQNFDLAGLKSARMVVASESNRYQTLNPGKVKELSGGDTVTAAFKGKDAFTYRPQYKVWLVSNHLINADADDSALWGRLKVIEFPVSHLGREDTRLKERMKSPEVQSGILHWAIEGARRWYVTRNLRSNPVVMESVTTHRLENDGIGQWIADCALSDKDDPDCFDSSEALYTSYRNWCHRNGFEPRSQRNFSFSLTNSKGYKGERRMHNKVQKRCILGLKVRTSVVVFPGKAEETHTGTGGN